MYIISEKFKELSNNDIALFDVDLEDNKTITASYSISRPNYTLPGYNYCGPGTPNYDVEPLSKLDILCREHDIVYMNTKDSNERLDADIIFTSKIKENIGTFNIKDKLTSIFILIVFSIKNTCC